MKLYTFVHPFKNYRHILNLVCVLEDYLVEGRDYNLKYETPESEVPWGVELSEFAYRHEEVHWLMKELFKNK